MKKIMMNFLRKIFKRKPVVIPYEDYIQSNIFSQPKYELEEIVLSEQELLMFTPWRSRENLAKPDMEKIYKECDYGNN